MEKCQLKQGFFFLRDCENNATITCPQCSRKVCKKHAKIMKGSGTPTCLDCIGKRMQAKKQAKVADDDWDDYYYDSSWSYGYRSRYYRNNRYRPWYYSDNEWDDDHYYDSYDLRSFDDNALEEDDSSDDLDDYQAEADLFDS